MNNNANLFQSHVCVCDQRTSPANSLILLTFMYICTYGWMCCHVLNTKFFCKSKKSRIYFNHDRPHYNNVNNVFMQQLLTIFLTIDISCAVWLGICNAMSRALSWPQHSQGDLMSPQRNRPKCSPTHFPWKSTQNLNRINKWPKNVTYLSNFRKTAEAKTHPIGKKLHNLVTLIIVAICKVTCLGTGGRPHDRIPKPTSQDVS
jgi:hypothetical protein